ncbi:ABC transporter ATP-binding protein [Vallitalea sp.]|jgi:ABC-2 type transport system ATP-binding protein|uniref:ABC transporter ATP-binding protein n=1 Tax=Vallitalea sp. TaxID=1882829 RepID=UPI0025F4CE14|nr:ABC transporter ATP-binding protein [Vallitalea sp.]MCT4685978.1 ABC transporter ATP-binding protein [Vallitalea sp.]
MLDIKKLSINYGKHKALDDITFHIDKGEVVGLLGPSGSGKTTFMNTVAGLIPYSHGEVLINGQTPNEKTKGYVSLLTESNAIPKWMSVEDIRSFYIDMYDDFNENKFDSILQDINIDISYSKKIKNLSKGMTQLLRLSLSIAREAKLYLFDEPLGGMDTLVREQVIDTIINNIDDDSTIIIATHLIQEVEKLLDKVIFIKNGQMLGIHDCEDLRFQNSQSIEKTFKEVMR